MIILGFALCPHSIIYMYFFPSDVKHMERLTNGSIFAESTHCNWEAGDLIGLLMRGFYYLLGCTSSTIRPIYLSRIRRCCILVSAKFTGILTRCTARTRDTTHFRQGNRCYHRWFSGWCLPPECVSYTCDTTVPICYRLVDKFTTLKPTHLRRPHAITFSGLFHATRTQLNGGNEWQGSPQSYRYPAM